MPTVLVVDDDRSIALMVRRALEPLEVDVVDVATAADARSAIEQNRPDAALLDIVLPGQSGLDLFREIQQIDRKLPVIFITADAGSETAIEAMQMGAFDYLAKPLDLPRLLPLVGRALETRRLMNTPVALRTEEVDGDGDELFIGRSPEMLDVFKTIGRVARQKVPVLVRGESGAGKELVARAIYQHSDRADGPFLAVNCAAIPDTLLESELFGHEKGAFTGAEHRRIGKFEQCNGGTIFLDEIGDMSAAVQSKMLRLLQDQAFERVGGNQTIHVDVRVIAATHRDLDNMIDEGDFRADLFYRLNGVTIRLPSLRERKHDISLLLQHFVGRAKRELGKPEIEGLAPESLELLSNYPWPGNVREMVSVVRQAVLNATGPVIVPQFLPEELRTALDPAAMPATGDNGAPDLAEFIDRRIAAGSDNLYAESVELLERFLIARVLEATGGNQTKTAEILGITRGKVRDRIAAFGISLDKTVRMEVSG